MSIIETIIKNTTQNIANANNTWKGWKEFFRNYGVEVIDDDSRLRDCDIVDFRKAVNGISVCTVMFAGEYFTYS